MKIISNNHIMAWIRREKHLLYQIGYIILQREDKIEKALLKTAQQFETSSLFDDSFKQNLIHTYIKLCKLEANMGKNTEVTRAVAEDLFQLDELERMVIYMKYVLAFHDQQTSLFLDVSPEEVSMTAEVGLKKLLENKNSRKFEDVNKLLSYHQGLLPLEEYKDINTKLQEENQLKMEYTEILDMIEQLRGYAEAIQPSNYFLMEGKPLTEVQKKRRKRNQVWVAFILSLLLMIGVGVSMFDPTSFEMWWKRMTSDVAYGEPVFISTTDQDIKLTITHVAADDYQTVLFYEIEDQASKDKFHFINDFDIKESHKLNSHFYNHALPNLLATEEGVSTGRLFLPPISNEEEEFTLTIYSIEETELGLDPQIYHEQDIVATQGNWEIRVPIVKHKSTIMELNETVELNDGIIHFYELEISPTGTFIAYEHKREDNDDQFHHYTQVQFGHLKVNGREVANEPLYFNQGYERQRGTGQIGTFESVFYERVDSISVYVDRLISHIDYPHEPLVYDLDFERLPTTINYLDTPIKIDSTVEGNQKIIHIIEDDYQGRPYDYLHFDIHSTVDEKGGYQGFHRRYRKDIWLDSDGNEIDETKFYYDHWRGTNQPRVLSLEHELEFYSESSEENILPPFSLYIYGHTSTTPIDKTFDLSIE